MSRNCGACSELQENSADFVVNGVTDSVCNSLKNNTGFNPESDNDDCTDLHNANDCLVGNMEDTVSSYQACDWKEFMPNFIHNLWTVLKSIICSICGLWKRAEKTDCEIDSLMGGKTFTIGETTEDETYIVAGKGVSFLYQDPNGQSIRDINFVYIGGGLARVNGSIWIHHWVRTGGGGQDPTFQDPKACYNYDNDGVDPQLTQTRRKNDQFHGERYYNSPGELLYEIRISLTQYPMIKSIYAGIGGPTGSGAYQVNLTCFTAGKEAYGQHPDSPKHTVPTGYIYVQARLLNIMHEFPDGQKYTPRGFMGIRGIAEAVEKALEELNKIETKDVSIELKADIEGDKQVVRDVKKEIDKLKKQIDALPAYTIKNMTVALTANVVGISAAVAGAKRGLDAAKAAIRGLDGTVTKRLRMSVVQHAGGKAGSTLYRASGGSVFRPRGTDTIPAMLTEGEYVIQRMAAHAIGDNVLQKLNHLDIAGAIQGLSARVGHNISTVTNTKNANLTINNYNSPSVGFVKGNRWVQSI